MVGGVARTCQTSLMELFLRKQLTAYLFFSKNLHLRCLMDISYTLDASCSLKCSIHVNKDASFIFFLSLSLHICINIKIITVLPLNIFNIFLFMLSFELKWVTLSLSSTLSFVSIKTSTSDVFRCRNGALEHYNQCKRQYHNTNHMKCILQFLTIKLNNNCKTIGYREVLLLYKYVTFDQMM